MEKVRFTEEKVISYIKEGLILCNFPDNLQIKSYILDNDTPIFNVYYEQKYKMLKILKVKDVINLMNFVFQRKGTEMDIKYIDIHARDGKINCDITMNLATYGVSRKKKRRR